MATTEQRTQDFKQLTIKDQQSAKTIETQMRRLQRRRTRCALEGKLSSNQREVRGAQPRELKEEKNAISRHFQELKGRMNKFRDGRGAGRLQELTLRSRPRSDAPRSGWGAPSASSSSASSRGKFETEREKVLRFYESSVEDEEKSARSSAAHMRKSLQSSATAGRRTIEEWDYLNNVLQARATTRAARRDGDRARAPIH